MADKIRGVLALLFGAFGLFCSYQRWHDGVRGWTPVLLLAAGLFLLSMGLWRLFRRPEDQAPDLLR